MSVRRLAVVATALLLLGACGSGADAGPASSASASPAESGEPSAAPSDSPTEDATASPGPTADASAAPSATPLASGPPGIASECKEPKLDTSGVEMVAVKLVRAGEILTATFTDDQPAPENKNLLWSIWATAADGVRTVQLGAEFSDENPVGHFVFADGKQTNLDTAMKVSGKKMTADFPVAAVTALGEGARWYATLTVEQETKDYCPGGRDIERKKVKGIAFPASWFAAP